MNQLEQDEPILSKKIRQNKLAIVPMIYHVHDCRVTVLDAESLRLKIKPASASDAVIPE